MKRASRSRLRSCCTITAFISISIGFDTIKAYFMAAVGVHKVIEMALAGVTASTLFH